MKREQISYRADGLDMRGWIHVPAGSTRRPGVLVFPDARGVGEHAKERAQRLAELGFVALACDLHGDAHVCTEMSQAMPLIGALRAEPARIRARAQGGLDALLAQSAVDPARVAAIGFCFGGTMALELARSGAPIAGVVGFHAGLSTAAPEDAKNIKGKVLICTGADDPAVPLEQRNAFEAEMRAGGVDWQMNLYGGVKHSFTEPDADGWGRPEAVGYSAKADRRSWGEMQAFFTEIFAVR